MKTAKILEIENCFIDCPYAELGCGIASHTIPKDCPLKDASQSKSVPSDEEIRIKARDFNKQFLRSYGSFGDMCYQEGAKWMRSQQPNDAVFTEEDMIGICEKYLYFNAKQEQDKNCRQITGFKEWLQEYIDKLNK